MRPRAADNSNELSLAIGTVGTANYYWTGPRCQLRAASQGAGVNNFADTAVVSAHSGAEERGGVSLFGDRIRGMVGTEPCGLSLALR